MDRDLSPAEFERFRDLAYELAGISYPREKLALLSNRIKTRLRASHTATYDAYLTLLKSSAGTRELQGFLDAVTTNETYFYRCPRHWQLFREWAQRRLADGKARREGLRIWSAASSNGAEAYTIAIVLRELLGANFGGVPAQILGTDLSQHILEEARAGQFTAHAVAQVPQVELARYFAKTGDEQFSVLPELQRVVKFAPHNLMQVLRGHPPFDCIFLRNVMIYFDPPTKQKVLENVHAVCKPGGILFVGEAESLIHLTQPFRYVAPSLFERPTAPATPAPAPVRS